MKSPEKSLFSSSLALGDLPALFRGGVIERSAGERDRDLVGGGVPTMGGVVVPFIVSLSTTTVALLGSVLGLGLELERPSDIFFPLSRPFG